MAHRLPPPYSKPLVELQKLNLSPRNPILVHCGNKAWDIAKNYASIYPMGTIVLPKPYAVWQYQWPVSQCEVWVIYYLLVTTEEIEYVANCLFEHGAKLIKAILLFADGYTVTYSR